MATAMEKAATSCLRLRRLQSFVREHQLDALVFIAGIDGGDHSGSCQALAYLLEGVSGRDLLTTTHVHSSLEDVVLFVYSDRVGIHCTPDAHDKLMPLMGLWGAGTEILCCTREELEDPDDQENFKIHAFVSLMNGVSKVGLALTPQREDGSTNVQQSTYAPGRVMEAEEWPLIQAYGLEDVGRRGFFTMSNTIVDVFFPLQQLYCEMDGAAVTHALSKSLPMFVQHWEELVTLLSTRSASDRLALTERLVGEPLLSYFAYGSLRPAPGVKMAVTMAPRVVFGVNTNNDAAPPTSTRLGEASSNGGPALHMVVEAADPKGALRAARTYFLSHAVLPALEALHCPAQSEERQEVEDELASRWTNEDVRALMLLYLSLIDATRAAIRHWCLHPAADPHSARDAAVEALEASAASRGCSGAMQGNGEEGAASRLRFALWSCDHMNVVKSNLARGERQLKVVRLSLGNICSTDGQGRLLGGLVYGETFLDVGSQPLVLTDGIPPLLSWGAAGAEELTATRVTHTLAQRVGKKPPSLTEATAATEGDGEVAVELGHPLADAPEEILLCLPCEGLASVQAQWYLFQGGLVVLSPHIAPLVVHFAAHVTSGHLDPGTDTVPTRLVLSCNTRPTCGPLEVLAPEWEELAFSLGPMRLSAQRHFHRVVLPAWEVTMRVLGVPFATRAAATDTVQHKGPGPTQSTTAAEMRDADSLQLSHQFAEHRATKRFQVRERDDVVAARAQALDQMEAEGAPLIGAAANQTAPCGAPPTRAEAAVPVEGSVPVAVLCGLPTSGHETVAASLLRFMSSEYDWEVVTESMADGHGINCPVEKVANSLRNAAISLRTRVQNSDRKAHVVLVIQGYHNMGTYIPDLKGTEPFQDGHCHLAGVTACLRAAHVFERRTLALPGLLGCIGVGVVDNIVLFGPRAEVAPLLKYLASFNPNARVLHATRTNIMRLGETIISKAPPPGPDLAHSVHVARALAQSNRASPSPHARDLQTAYMRVSGQIHLSLFVKHVQDWVNESWKGADAIHHLEESMLQAARVLHVQAYVQWRTAAGAVTITEIQVSRSAVTVAGCPLRADSDKASADAKGWASEYGFGEYVGVVRKSSTSLCAGQEAAELVATGTRLDLEKLKSLLEKCQVAEKEVAKITRDSLSRSELAALQEIHKLDELPPNWFYNGTSYVNFDNTTSEYHPNLEQHIEKLIEEKNREIDNTNLRERTTKATMQPMHVEVAIFV